MPDLSLCLIVRNEAEMLPDFLDATAELRDEFIAVDTGSTDGTLDLLRQAGATIIEQPWADDFAAARNTALAAATGRWILVLDADERPSAELATQIRALLADETAGAATIRLRNQLPHGHVRESDLLRLWRHDPLVVYRYPIHEDPSEGIAECLRRDGRRLVNLSGICEHLGYTATRAAARQKKERDLALLTRCLEADGDDWYSWYKLLELARFWEDRELWRDTAQQVAARLDGPPPVELPERPWNGELVALVAAGLFGKPADQVAWLDRWEDRVPPAPAFYLQRGLALERDAQPDRAHADFQRCRDLPAGSMPMLTTVRPLLGLCRLAAQRGDLLTAGDHVHQALSFNPRDPEALLAAVSFAWLNGGAEARDAFAAEYRQLHGDCEELNLTLGEHALQAGLWDDAAASLGPLVDERPLGRAALMLARCQLAQGQVDAARQRCKDLMESMPEAGLGFLTCCLVLGETADFSLDLSQEQADRALKGWLRTLWQSRQADLMTKVVDHFPLVAGVFPWLPQFLTEETKRLTRS